MRRSTVVDIREDQFWINGKPTYEGLSYQGHKVEGLLINSRMVQAIFDDQNPETRHRWDYPDGPFDAYRNVTEFIQAMPTYRDHGVLGFTINLQCGSPEGYSKIEDQRWDTGAFEPDGSLRPTWSKRLSMVLDKADELDMVPIVGFFYFGQDRRLKDDDAVRAATANATDFLVNGGWTNVLVEIGNEVDMPLYSHATTRQEGNPELIEIVKKRSEGKVANDAGRLLVSTSTRGDGIPLAETVDAVDFVLLHGNSVKSPDRIREMVEIVRDMDAYRGQPILFNEDDHFDFDKQDNHFLAALSRYAGWGFFDYRMKGEGFDEGYQSPPVNWGISSERKRGFFELAGRLTGYK
jgi:hypothetical protein